MLASNQSLVMDLVEWIAREPRSYAEVLEAWRTSCPRLTIWEDAMDQGLVYRTGDKPGRAETVAVTDKGIQLLRSVRNHGHHSSMAAITI